MAGGYGPAMVRGRVEVKPGHVSLEYVFSGTNNGFEYWKNAEDPLQVIYESGDWLLKPSGFGAGVV